MPGKCIGLYGINGIGKSTQARELVSFLHSIGISAVWIKYPVYTQEPTGPEINRFLRDEAYRKAHPMTGAELQGLFARNLLDHQPTVKEYLAAGTWVVAEAYALYSALAWGIEEGAREEDVLALYAGSLEPDFNIVLSGERFDTATEAGHMNETNTEKMRRVNQRFESIARDRKWPIVNANQSIEDVGRDIIQSIKPLLH